LDKKKRTKSRNLAFWTKNEIHNFGQIRNSGQNGDFGSAKNEILDKVFLVSLNKLLAQYKISAYVKSTNFPMKQV